MHRPTVGSYGVAVSYQGIPVGPNDIPQGVQGKERLAREECVRLSHASAHGTDRAVSC